MAPRRRSSRPRLWCNPPWDQQGAICIWGLASRFPWHPPSNRLTLQFTPAQPRARFPGRSRMTAPCRTPTWRKRDTQTRAFTRLMCSKQVHFFSHAISCQIGSVSPPRNMALYRGGRCSVPVAARSLFLNTNTSKFNRTMAIQSIYP